MRLGVLIGMPSAIGLVPLDTMAALLQMDKPVRFEFAATARQPTDIARNILVKAAIDGGFDFLFFVDDDNPPPRDALVKLLAADKDIVGGAYVNRQSDKLGQRSVVAAYQHNGAIGIQQGRNDVWLPITRWRDPGPLHRVDLIGAGCLLIRRNVLVTLSERHNGHPFEFIRDDSYILNEDQIFCERAREAGFDIWLHEDVRPLHITDPALVRWSGKLGPDSVVVCRQQYGGP